jgi:hypothetical protein
VARPVKTPGRFRSPLAYTRWPAAALLGRSAASGSPFPLRRAPVPWENAKRRATFTRLLNFQQPCPAVPRRARPSLASPRLAVPCPAPPCPAKLRLASTRRALPRLAMPRHAEQSGRYHGSRVRLVGYPRVARTDDPRRAVGRGGLLRLRIWGLCELRFGRGSGSAENTRSNPNVIPGPSSGQPSRARRARCAEGLVRRCRQVHGSRLLIRSNSFSARSRVASSSLASSVAFWRKK